MSQPNNHPPTPNLLLNKKKPFLHPHHEVRQVIAPSKNSLLTQYPQTRLKIQRNNDEEKSRAELNRKQRLVQPFPAQFQKQLKNLSINVSTQQTEQRDSQLALKSPYSNQNQFERIKTQIDRRVGSFGYNYFEDNYAQQNDQGSLSSQSKQKNRDCIDMYIKAIFDEYGLGQCIFQTPKFKEIVMSPGIKKDVKQFNVDEQAFIQSQDSERKGRGNHKSKAKQLKNLFKKQLGDKPEQQIVISSRKTLGYKQQRQKIKKDILKLNRPGGYDPSNSHTHNVNEKDSKQQVRFRNREKSEQGQIITIQKSYMKSLYEKMKSLNLQSQKIVQLLQYSIQKQEFKQK